MDEIAIREIEAVYKDSKEKILENLRNKGNLETAARAGGINPATLRIWRREDEEFDKQIKEIQECIIDQIEETAFKCALDPDPRNNGLRIALLKTRRKEIYGEQDRRNQDANKEKKYGLLEDGSVCFPPINDLPEEVADLILKAAEILMKKTEAIGDKSQEEVIYESSSGMEEDSRLCGGEEDEELAL